MSGSGKAVPSKEFVDLEQNMLNADKMVNSVGFDFENRESQNGNNRTLTFAGINNLADQQRDQFDSTFTAQFSFKRIGNISLYVGNSLPEQDKLNSYQFPDDSGEWYGPIQSQSFPIIIPADPSSDNGWSVVSSASQSWVSGNFGNKNYLSNHNFLTKSPDQITHPSAIPTDYTAGTQIFSGVFVESDVVGFTYSGGRVSWTNQSGSIYLSIPNSDSLEYISQLKASVSDFDGAPRDRGVSLALSSGFYVVSIGFEALEDENSTPTPLGSVKLEKGSVATSHNISNRLVAEKTTTYRTAENRFSDYVNLKDFESLVVLGLWDDAIDTAQNLAEQDGKSLKIPEGLKCDVSKTFEVIVPFNIESGASINQTANVDTLHIFPSGGVYGNGEVRVDEVIGYSSVAVLFSTEFDGSYDSTSISNKMGPEAGLNGVSIITNPTDGSGVALELRTISGTGSNQYISWLNFARLRIIGRFLDGIKLTKPPGSDTWINGNIFSNIIIDKSINKIVGETYNTYNTYNNVITQPSVPDTGGNTVILGGGYSQGYYWDGDKVVLSGGFDDIQRIAPNLIYYGDGGTFLKGNMTRGTTRSTWFSRDCMNETYLGMKTLIPNISGGLTAQVGRGMFEYSKMFGEKFTTFSNQVDITNFGSTFRDDLNYSRKSFSGGYEASFQHLALARNGGSGVSGDWGTIWCNKGGVVNARNIFQAHIIAAPTNQDGLYRIGLGRQDNDSSELISDGILLEYQKSTSVMTARMYSNGIETASRTGDVSIPSDGTLYSIYIVGDASEVKIAIQYSDNSGNNPDFTTQYLEMIETGDVDDGRFVKLTLFGGALPNGLLSPFFQLKNTDNGQPQMCIHSVEVQGHRTTSTI